MHLDNLISDLALILIVAGIVTLIFRKIKLPVVLGYIVAGFLISPHFSYMPTVVEVADIEVWANIGVVFLMFGLGLEFSFKKLATVGGSAVIVAMTVMLSMIFIGAGVGYMLGWAKMDCIFLGGMLSMSSTMIILKAYEEYDLKERRFAQLVLSTLVIEDIAGIFMMIILSTISVSQAASGVATFKEIGLLLMYLVIWLILGIYLIPSFLNKVSKLMNDELMVIVSLAICLGMVVIADFIGFSEALGAFMAGSILAGTVRAGYIERLTKPIKDLFGAVFFVSVGMMIQPELLVKCLGPILIITVATILGQMIFSTIGILLSGQSLHTAIRGGFSMVQIGEFSFIIATLGSSLGVISDFLYPVVVCVSVITTFTTPLFIKNSASVYKFLDEKLPDKLWVFIKKNTSEDRSNKDKDEDWSKYIKKVLSRTFICSVVMYIIYAPFQGTPGAEAACRHVCIFGDICRSDNCGSDMRRDDPVYKHDAWNERCAVHKAVAQAEIQQASAAHAQDGQDTDSCMLCNSGAQKDISHTVRDTASSVSSSSSTAYQIGLFKRRDDKHGAPFFMENFSGAHTLARQKRERGRDEKYSWLNEELLVAEFQVTDTVENKTIYDFTKSRAFRVTIIKIIRGDKYINLPTPDRSSTRGRYTSHDGHKCGNRRLHDTAGKR